MKKTLFIATLVLATQAWAETRTITIGKTEVTLHDIRVGSDDTLHSGKLLEPTVITLNDGNKIKLVDEIYLHSNNMVSMAEAEIEGPWKINDQLSIPLRCLHKNRFTTFHSNGQYHMNCQLGHNAYFPHGKGMIKAKADASIDLHADGSPKYIGKIFGQNIIRLADGRNVQVYTNTDIAFHENGNPRFLRFMEPISFDMKESGTLEFFTPISQREKRPQATKFYDDGTVKKGYLTKPLTVKLQNRNIQFDPSLIFFHPNGKVGYGLLKSIEGSKTLKGKSNQGSDLEVNIREGMIVCINENEFLVDPKQCQSKFQ